MNHIKDPILGEYFIQIDDYNYSAFKTITPDSGITYDHNIGHFSNLGNALKRIADHKDENNIATTTPVTIKKQSEADEVSALLNNLPSKLNNC